jgi:hypothetical protein
MLVCQLLEEAKMRQGEEGEEKETKIGRGEQA